MVKDGHKQVRIGDKDRAVLEALRDKNIGDNDSDRIRLGIRALARENKIPVPA